MRTLLGEERARVWLTGMRSNDTQAYENNIAVLDAVDRGEVALGLINHYYWFQKVAELGEENVSARLHFMDSDDPGALVNVAGAGILATSADSDAAAEAVAFLLSEEAQTYFADETAEYPVVEGITSSFDLPPLTDVDAQQIDLNELDSLDQTLALLDEVGLT